MFCNMHIQYLTEVSTPLTSVVTSVVPKFQYLVPIPGKIHGSRYQFRYQIKTQKHANKKKKNYFY